MCHLGQAECYLHDVDNMSLSTAPIKLQLLKSTQRKPASKRRLEVFAADIEEDVKLVEGEVTATFKTEESADSLIDRAEKLAQIGEYGSALHALDAALRIDSRGDWRIFDYKSQIYSDMESYFVAIKCAEKAVAACCEKGVNAAAALATLGRAQLNFGEVAMAVDSFTKALASDSDIDVKADLHTASTLLSVERESAAFPSLHRRIVITPQLDALAASTEALPALPGTTSDPPLLDLPDPPFFAVMSDSQAGSEEPHSCNGFDTPLSAEAGTLLHVEAEHSDGVFWCRTQEGDEGNVAGRFLTLVSRKDSSASTSAGQAVSESRKRAKHV